MKLTKKNYYSVKANKKYMSYSQFKDFCECPAMAMAKINNTWCPEPNDNMLVGSYVDAWLDGKIDEFKEINPQIFTMKGELKSQFKKADELIKIIKKDKYFYNLLKKGRRQRIFTCNINGVPFKAKLDTLSASFIIDGKVLKDCNDIWYNGMKTSFIYQYRYDLQGAIYQMSVLQTLNKKLPFILSVVTKERVPDKRVFQLSEETIENAMQEIIQKAPIFNAVKNGEEPIFGCGKCEYCRSIKKIDASKIEII